MGTAEAIFKHALGSRHLLWRNGMLTIQKQDNKCSVSYNGQQLGIVEIFDNPCHMTNCYVKLNMKHLDISISAELFEKLKALAGRPLQAMVDSTDMEAVTFLTAGGFIRKRRCYGTKACLADYVGGRADLKICSAFAGDPDYELCCSNMYRYYVDTHKAINPWTADYAAFCTKLPGRAVYAKMEDHIASLAFIEENEIAYVCGNDKDYFSYFAQALASSMLADHKSIFFESDDCDWAAMTLKSLFVNQDEASFDTYIFSSNTKYT